MDAGGFATTGPAGAAFAGAGFRGGSLGTGWVAAPVGFGGFAAVLAIGADAAAVGFEGLSGGGEFAGLAVAAGAFAGTRAAGTGAVRGGETVRAGVVSMRLGAAVAGAAGLLAPVGDGTLGVAAARAIAAAGDSRSCGGGGLSGSLGGGLAGGGAAGGAGAWRSGKAVVVAGNADVAGAVGAGWVSLARVGVVRVAGDACCAPVDPAASNSPPTTPTAPMARIQRLDFMVPPTLRPKPPASAFRTRPQAMPTERRRAECKRANRLIQA